MNIVLMGFQACGKTTLGEKVAEKMQREFVDTDRLIEHYHPGLTVSDIFQINGEHYFRKLESEVLYQLHMMQKRIIAIGGGSLMQESNRIFLKQHSYFIYLKTDPLILKERIWQRSSLPAYLDLEDPLTSFFRIYSKRALVYEAYADQILEMDNLTLDQAVQALINRLS